MKQPLDKPFVCRKGHVTEPGWIGPHGERCLTCRSFRWLKYNRIHAEKRHIYNHNRARTWGADKVNAAARRHHLKYRDRELARMKAWKKRTGYKRWTAPRLEMI